MADLTIAISIDATGTKAGAADARNAVKSVKDEAVQMGKSLASAARIDLKDLGGKLRSAGELVASMGTRLRGVGTSLALAVTLPLAGLGASVLKAGGEYEKALNIFQSVTKANTGEMERAAIVAKELGADLTLPATSAKDAALAMTELGKAGLTAAQSMDAAKGVLQLAAAGQLDEARAAEIAANALNAFKLEASDTTRVANLLAAAANASSAEVDDIALAMQQAGSSFASAKLPIEDMVTAIAALANAGIKGSDAGTSLKTFVLSLQAPTAKAADTMRELGISVFDTSGRMRQMPDIIGQFQTAMDGLTDEQRTSALYKIFGSDAIRAAQILFSTGTEGFAKLKEQVTASGAAAELANARMKGLSGAWEGFKSQLETIGIQIYEVVKAPLTSFLQGAATFAGDAANAFGRLSPFVQQAVIGFVAFVAAMGPILIIVGSVVAAIGTIVSAIGALVASAGTVGIVAAAFVGLGTTLAPVIAIIAGWAAVIYQAWQANFGGIRDLVGLFIAWFQEAWNTTLERLRDLTSSVLAEVQGFWKTNGDDIMALVKDLSETLKSIWTGILDFYKQHSAEIKAIAQAAWAIIKETVVGAVRIIADVISVALKAIRGDWDGAWTATKKLLMDVATAWHNIVNSAGTILLNTVKAILQNIWNLNTWILGEAFELGSNIIRGLINGIESGAGTIASAVRNFAKRHVVDVFKATLWIQSPSRVTYEIGEFVTEGLKDGIESGAAEVVKVVESLSQRVLGGFNELFGGRLADMVRDTFEILGDSSQSWGSRMKSIFSGISQSFRNMLKDMIGAWLNQKMSGTSGTMGPGGTGVFNPNGGGGLPTGSIDEDGNYVVNGNDPQGFFKSIFGPKRNILTGKDSKWGGILGGIGSVANLIGGMVGGRTGTMLSSIGTGMQIGSMFGPIGAGIGAAIGAVTGIFKINSQRRKEETIRNDGIKAAFDTLRTQFDALINDVRTLRVDPSSAIAQGTSLGAQVRSQYLEMANSLKDGKTRRHALIDVRRVDALIAEKMAALRAVAEVAQASGDRARRILPEFASGVFMSPAFMAFRRQNGMLGGQWTGRDTIPSMLAQGEMVLNPMQQQRIKANAGFDVFKTAAIPGYAGGGMVQSQPAVTVAETPVQVNVHIEQDLEGRTKIWATSSDGRKVIANVVSDAHANDEIKTKRRGI